MALNGKRGFGSMDPEQHRAICSKAGKASHRPGVGGHEWTSSEAKAAGSKGGKISKGGRGRHADDTDPKPAV